LNHGHLQPPHHLRNIPLEAYDYVVNGKPALERVMERQSVTTEKASNITSPSLGIFRRRRMGEMAKIEGGSFPD